MSKRVYLCFHGPRIFMSPRCSEAKIPRVLHVCCIGIIISYIDMCVCVCAYMDCARLDSIQAYTGVI